MKKYTFIYQGLDPSSENIFIILKMMSPLPSVLSYIGSWKKKISEKSFLILLQHNHFDFKGTYLFLRAGVHFIEYKTIFYTYR